MPLRFPRYAQTSSGVRDKVLRQVVERINARYHKETKREGRVLSTLRNSVFSGDRPYISSGVLPIDCIVGFGLGFPTGIVEIFGPESSGKTAVVERTLAEAQRLGYYTGMFASEYSLNYKRALAVGLNEDQLLIFESDTIEDFYDELKAAVLEIRKLDKETPIVISWDTISATPTRAELVHKAGLENSDMGNFALKMSRFFRRLVKFLFINRVCLLCVNQTRVNLAQMYGSKESTYGGKALRFYAWVRCRISKVKSIPGPGDQDSGFISEFRTVKNKTGCPPWKRCRLPILWDRGIDSVLAAWEYAVQQKVFQRRGAVYTFKGQLLTRNSFPKFYRAHREEIDRLIRQSVSTGGQEE